MSRGWILVLACLAVLAGCLGAGPGTEEATPDQNEDPQGPAAPGDEVDRTDAPPPWPSIEEADARPGEGIGDGAVLAPGLAPGARCTANFVFTSPHNDSVYLGTAAHCFWGQSLGTKASVGDGDPVTTRLAYSSLKAMNLTREEHADACGGDPTVSLDDSAMCWNDFALLEVDAEDRDRVHPAMLGFGGPSGEPGTASPGDVVFTNGDSFRREAAGDALDARAGVALDTNRWRTLVHTGIPGVHGDSGSPVVLEDGRALGVLNYLHHVPPTVNGVSRLDALLDFASEEAGFDVELATWNLLDPLEAPSPVG